MGLSNVGEYKTQNYEPVTFAELGDIRFEPIRLWTDAPGVPDYSPWGFVVGPLAIHVVYHHFENDEPDAVARFRVSARESGGAIADFDRLEIALGFVAETKDLDWSGSKDAAAEIVARNGAAVLAAYSKWSTILLQPAEPQSGGR